MVKHFYKIRFYPLLAVALIVAVLSVVIYCAFNEEEETSIVDLYQRNFPFNRTGKVFSGFHLTKVVSLKVGIRCRLFPVSFMLGNAENVDDIKILYVNKNPLDSVFPNTVLS